MSDSIPKKPHEDPACECDGCRAATLFSATHDGTMHLMLTFGDGTPFDPRLVKSRTLLPMPDHKFECEESAESLADSIGRATLAEPGSPRYQQSVSGWSRSRDAVFYPGMSALRISLSQVRCLQAHDDIAIDGRIFNDPRTKDFRYTWTAPTTITIVAVGTNQDGSVYVEDADGKTYEATRQLVIDIEGGK